MKRAKFVRHFGFACAVVAGALSGGACTHKIDIPTEFPTPPPAKPASTPIAKRELKRDTELEQQFSKIAEAAKGKVGAMAVNLGTGDAAMLNADQMYPMQSVYKLPIAMSLLDQVRLDRFGLDEKIGVTKEDFVRQGFSSKLRDQNPEGGEFTIRELVRLSMVESDGTASDVLLRLQGGPAEAQSFLSRIGVKDLNVVNSEKEISRDWETQYRNSSTPAAAVDLLRWLAASGTPSVNNSSDAAELSEWQTLMQFMAESNPGARRLKGDLPEGTYVAHKTGTGGTKDGITGATNDIGLIRMPSGQFIAVAVFVSDSPADMRTRESVIAKIAKATWDKWNR